MKAQVYTQKGQKEGTIEISDAVFGLKWNGDLVHHVITALQANLRRGTAHTKDRSEVRGGGKKPWRQKGTGRARHGSSRSPIWIGGGVTHGPRVDKIYGKKINIKERAKGLCIVLSRKMHDGEILFVDTLALDAPKTRFAKDILASLSTIEGFEGMDKRSQNAVLVVTSGENDDIRRAFANMGHILVKPVQNISALDVARFKYMMVVRPDEVVGALEGRLNKTPRRAKTLLQNA